MGRKGANKKGATLQPRLRAEREPTAFNPHFSHWMCLRCSFGEADTTADGETVSGHTVEPPDAGDARRRQPEGPVEEADRVRRRACAMHHIALRTAPALIGFLNRRRHIQCENAG